MRLPFDGISSWWILGVFEVAMMPQWHQEHLHLPYHACSWHRSFPPHPATAQHRAVVCVRSCSSLSVAVVRLGQRHSKMVCLRFYLLQPKAHRLSGLLEPPCLNPTQDAGHLWEVVALPPIWGGQLVLTWLILLVGHHPLAVSIVDHQANAWAIASMIGRKHGWMLAATVLNQFEILRY